MFYWLQYTFEPEDRKKAKELFDVAKEKGTNMEKIEAIKSVMTELKNEDFVNDVMTFIDAKL